MTKKRGNTLVANDKAVAAFFFALWKCIDVRDSTAFFKLTDRDKQKALAIRRNYLRWSNSEKFRGMSKRQQYSFLKRRFSKALAEGHKVYPDAFCWILSDIDKMDAKVGNTQKSGQIKCYVPLTTSDRKKKPKPLRKKNRRVKHKRNPSQKKVIK